MPIALVAAGAALVWLAPAERTLGPGIRWVYVHVGLMWAGTLGGVVSMIAARANWGAVFLAEPRMAAALRFLALAAIQGTFALSLAIATALSAWATVAIRPHRSPVR